MKAIKWLFAPPIRYYCPTCNDVHNPLFVLSTNGEALCPYCREICEKIELEYTKWREVGVPVTVGVFLLMGVILTWVCVMGGGEDIIAGLLIIWIVLVGVGCFALVTMIADEDRRRLTNKVMKMKGITPPTLFRSAKFKSCPVCHHKLQSWIKRCIYCGYMFEGKK